MTTLEFVCDLNAPIEKVWAFHDTIETLFKLTPPHTRVHLQGEAVPMRPGVVYHLKMRRMGIPFSWDACILSYDPPNRFVDQQVKGKGPFKAWQHEHILTKLPGDRTRLTDRVTYTPPFGPLGRIAHHLFLRRDIEAMFRYRHQITRQNVEKPDV